MNWGDGVTVQERNGTKGKTIAAVIINALIVIFTVYGMIRFFTVGGSGNMTVMNTQCFRFFTVDSNLLVALASLLLLIVQLGTLRSGGQPAYWLLVLKHVGTTAVGVTFFTVFCFLGTLYGYRSMVEGVSFYMHLLTPLLAMIGFCLLETGPALRFRIVFLGLIPTVLYGIAYVSMVVFQKRWPDFYGFNIGGRWILSCVLMAVATLLISVGLWALRRAAARRRGKAVTAEADVREEDGHRECSTGIEEG